MTSSARWHGLAVETSGHMFRLFGSDAMRRDLDALVDRFEHLGTTAFSCAEFDRIVGGLYEYIRTSVRKLPYQDRGRSFTSLRAEALFSAPPYIKGGPKLLDAVLNGLELRLSHRAVTPRRVAVECSAQWLMARWLLLSAGTKQFEVHDRSSCCMWGNSRLERCPNGPDAAVCKLFWVCGESRSAFFSSLDALSASDVSEAPGIKRDLARLKTVGCKELLRHIVKEANDFGDSIIFGEVPPEWHILTRDRAFSLLQRLHHPHQRVFYVRAPRYDSGSPCTLVFSPEYGKQALDGVLVNISDSGAAVQTNEPLEPGIAVGLECDAFDERRSGFVVQPSEQSNNGWFQRISFRRRRSTRRK